MTSVFNDYHDDESIELPLGVVRLFTQDHIKEARQIRKHRSKTDRPDSENSPPAKRARTVEDHSGDRRSAQRAKRPPASNVSENEQIILDSPEVHLLN